MSVEIRRSSARFVDRAPGRMTRHAFSFGPNYDAERLGFGPMVCHDDHLLGDGVGFELHRHTGLEIVTWVLSGALEHTDSAGTSTVVGPDEVAVLSAGAGVEHSEVAVGGATRFVQVWLTAADPDRAPAYAVTAVDVGSGRLTPVARPLPDAELSVARLEAGQVLTLPEAARVHVYVVSGALLRNSLAEPLSAGDALEMTDQPAYAVTAAVPTELLVWTFGSGG